MIGAQGGADRGSREKACLAVAVVATGRFPVKLVADTLAVARSNRVEHIKGTGNGRGSYRRQGDEELLGANRHLTDARPTYGYRRHSTATRRPLAGARRRRGTFLPLPATSGRKSSFCRHPAKASAAF